MLKDIFGSLGFVIVGSDILFWAYFFIMDKVSVFESSDFGELRIIVDPKGDVWFVASDVAKSLGYINAKDAVKRHVDDDDSILLQVSDNQWGVNQSILKTRYIDSIRIINESGLYSLILSSKLESAKRFKRWITSEVLPSIRKTGEYKTSSGGKGILVPDFSNPADAARAWADQYEAAQKAIAEKSQAEAEKQQALKTIEEHKPDVEFAESFRKVDHNNMWLIRDIAKKLEQNGVIIAEKNLRSFLEEAKFMFRNGLGKWELYSNVVAKGYGVYRSSPYFHLNNILIMFSDLKKGFQVHTLDTNTVPKYELGKVVAVSEPRYLPPQPGQYQAMQTRVVDLTVELTGETKTYTVPESQNVAKAMGITLSTSIDPIMNELNAIKSTSQDIIDSVDTHRAKIEACESILEDINPAFKQTREQDRKIAGIENKVNDLTDSFEDLKKLIVERLK